MRRTAAALLLLTLSAAHADTAADADAVQRAVHVCASCHGPEGRSTNKLAPSLAGQTREYTIRQLQDFRSQTRAETDTQAYMWGISALLSDEVVRGLADYYAQQAPGPAHPTQSRLEAAGRTLYERGLPDKGVRACASCHGDNAEGAVAFPRLAGQNADYVFRQLRAFRTPLRPHGVLMKQEIQALSDGQMRALAAYVQSR